MCKLNYASEFTLNPDNTGLSVVQDFKANGLYDPDYTGIGHQPKGFDELKLLYHHFTVIASHITVTYLADSTVNVIPLIWGIQLVSMAGEAAGKTLTDLIEDKRSSFKQGGIVFNAATRANQRSCGFNLKRFFNVHTTDEDIFQTSDAADPAELAHYNVWAVCTNATEPPAIPFVAKIQYTVICHEPITLAQS